MTKHFKLLSVCLCTLALPVFTACDDDDDDDALKPESPAWLGTVTFENEPNAALAGPTSYGANLYSEFGTGQFVEGSAKVGKSNATIRFGLNSVGDYYNVPTLYNGGMFLSQFNYRSNPADKSGDWWYSYENQCSVYNTDSQDGLNKGAGDDGSNTFAIVNGWCDPATIANVYGQGGEIKLGGFKYGADVNVRIGELEVCNTSYVYGVITKGNAFSQSLASTNGWFKVQAYGYDADGRITNGGVPVEMYLCNYGAGIPVIPDDDWEDWDLSALGEVNRVVFNFVGSDTGEYGLNTPAYLAIDNIEIYSTVK